MGHIFWVFHISQYVSWAFGRVKQEQNMINDKNILQIIGDKGDTWFIALVQNFYFLPIPGHWSSTDANDVAKFGVEWKIGGKDNDISFDISAPSFKRMVWSKNLGKVASGLWIINRWLIGVNIIFSCFVALHPLSACFGGFWIFILVVFFFHLLNFFNSVTIKKPKISSSSFFLHFHHKLS